MTTENTPQMPMLMKYVNENAPDAVKKRYAGLVDAAKSKRFGVLDADVVVLDTETTGVSFKRDELIQIAAARMCDGEITEWFVTFVDPGRRIPDDIQHLTDIHPEQIEGAPTPQEALAQLVEFVGDSDIVAHNADFDKNFTTKHPEGAALLNNTWIDSLDLARIALPRMKSHRLKDLIHAFGGPASTHRADDDVAATCVLYRVLLAAVDAMPDDLIVEISRMATLEEWPTVRVFKHFASEAAVRIMQSRQQQEIDPGPINLDAIYYDLRRLRRNSLTHLRMTSNVDAEDVAQEGFGTLNFPTDQEILDEYGPQGVLSRAYEECEPRSEQMEMAKAVNHAFSTSDNLVVEAGTGVGKSMAYLIPAVMTAKKNGITVGVATKTNNLLDQLVNKELPLLNRYMDGVNFASLKGFSHYPCLYSINRLVQEGPKMVEFQGEMKHQAPALAGLLSFIDQSEYDDIDGLKIDFRRLPRYRITTTSHECLRRKCPFYGKSCYVHGARMIAESADVVVTNHSLLFCDLVTDGGLLPPIRHWVVDEAHGAEDEGRKAFSLSISADSLLRLVRKLASDDPSSNVFMRAERLLAGKRPKSELEGAAPLPGMSGMPGEATTPIFALAGKAISSGESFGQSAKDFANHIKDLLYFDLSPKSRGYEYVDLWLSDSIRTTPTFGQLKDLGAVMYDDAEKLLGDAMNLVAYLDDFEKAASIQAEIASAVMELKKLLEACEVILRNPSPAYAYAANLSRNKDRHIDSLSALLVNIGNKLNETLFARTHSVVFTSATLSVDNSFSSFDSAVGLGQSEGSHCQHLQLDSSYNFNENMTVYVVKDMPEPNESKYLKALQDLLIHAHVASEGSTLTLFTNRKEMEACYDVVNEALKPKDLRLVCQKWGVSVKGLRDDFIADKHLSLFALKSFWEGFDAPGSTLRTVIIPKLPFKKPSDPLSCERQQTDAQAWAHFVLPEAVIDVKQAAGRLIRSSTDKGSLVLADKRLVSKGYGKKFLRSLPSNNIHCVTAAELVELLAEAVEE